MLITNIFKGIVAYRMLDKDSKKIFKLLPGNLKRLFFKLESRELRQEFLLYVEVLRANDQEKVMKTAREMASKTGAPSVDYYDLLKAESRNERQLAEGKLNKMAMGLPRGQSGQQEGYKDTEPLPDQEEVSRRMKMMRERENLLHRNKGLGR